MDHLQQPHVAIIPFMAPGHSIPTLDIARGLAKSGVTITIFTTPLNAKRFESAIARDAEAGFRIRIITVQIPLEEQGLPKSWECVDMIPSMDLVLNFFLATSKLQPSIEQFFIELKPSPCCLVSDMCLPWTANLAEKFHIPRILFHGFGCFSLLCIHYFNISEVYDNVTSDSEELIMVPNLAQRVELTKAQIEVSGLVKPTKPAGWKEIHEQMIQAEENAYGIVMNTFEELEHEYIDKFREATGKKVWCIGPVSLFNKENLDKAERGNKSSGKEQGYSKWLDSQKPNSVIYACLGSLTRLATTQMIELGLGLELSNRPFIWVVREASEEFKKWLLEEKFEERIKDKGVLIHGWAPQVLILSHPSIGGFLTHGGWNSTLEAICSGLPMITWPLFSEQFINEKLIVNILKIGVEAGVKIPVPFGYEEKVGTLLNRHDIKKVVEKLMDEEEEEGQLRRKRAKELSRLARKTVDEGGSSHANLTKLIQDIVDQANLVASLVSYKNGLNIQNDN